jgi:hypothetical protein
VNAPTPIDLRHATDLEAPLWSGRPTWRASALRVWKLGWAAWWFALLLADGAHAALASPRAPAPGWAGELRLLAISAVALGGLAVLAWLTRRTTRYSIEARSVTLKYGIALPARLVIPYAAIADVSARIHRDGTGDIALRLKPGQRVAYPKLWPHARPWRLSRPEPMLRGVPDADLAAALLCRRLSQAAAAPRDVI